MDSIITAVAKVGANYTVGITFDLAGDRVTSLVSFLPREGKKGAVRTVKVEGTAAEVEAALPDTVAKAGEMIARHDGTIDDLAKQLEAAEKEQKEKTTAKGKKPTPAKPKGGKDDDASHSEGDGIETIERTAPAAPPKPANPASKIEIAMPPAAPVGDPTLLDL